MLGNDQRSTQVRLSTSGDAYQPGVVTIATDLYAPRITATKTVDSATASLGDTLSYTVGVQNTGADAATGTAFTDAIPEGTAFVPGSVELNGAQLTDAVDGDAGEFVGGQVRVRLGTLAPTSGSATVHRFDVTVATAGLESGATIENVADLAFQAATTGVPSTVTTISSHHRGARARPGDRQDARAGALARAAEHVHDHGRQRRRGADQSGLVTVSDMIEAPGLTLNGTPAGAGWASPGRPSRVRARTR